MTRTYNCTVLAFASCLVIAVTAHGVAGAQARPAHRPTETPPTANDLFAVLDFQAQEFKPATVDEWIALLQDHGFKRTGDFSSSGMWEKADSTGTLRASAFYLPEETSVWLFFIPAVRVPMADPVLTALLRDADSTKLEDDGAVEIGFKPKSFRVGGREGVRAEFARLLGSTVTLRRVVVKWRR